MATADISVGSLAPAVPGKAVSRTAVVKEVTFSSRDTDGYGRRCCCCCCLLLQLLSNSEKLTSDDAGPAAVVAVAVQGMRTLPRWRHKGQVNAVASKKWYVATCVAKYGSKHLRWITWLHDCTYTPRSSLEWKSSLTAALSDAGRPLSLPCCCSTSFSSANNDSTFKPDDEGKDDEDADAEGVMEEDGD